MNEPILEPCPFCGVHLVEAKSFTTRTTKTMMHPGDIYGDESCIISNVRVIISTLGDADGRVAKWNTRRHPVAKELKEILQDSLEILDVAVESRELLIGEKDEVLRDLRARARTAVAKAKGV